MKDWIVSDELRRDAELFKLVEDSRALLEEEIGPSAGVIKADWRLKDVGGQHLAVLTLADWTWPDGVFADFEPRELASPTQARRKLRWLWGDLLQARNHQQIRELQQAAGQ